MRPWSLQIWRRGQNRRANPVVRLLKSRIRKMRRTHADERAPASKTITVTARSGDRSTPSRSSSPSSKVEATRFTLRPPNHSRSVQIHWQSCVSSAALQTAGEGRGDAGHTGTVGAGEYVGCQCGRNPESSWRYVDLEVDGDVRVYVHLPRGYRGLGVLGVRG